VWGAWLDTRREACCAWNAFFLLRLERKCCRPVAEPEGAVRRLGLNLARASLGQVSNVQPANLLSACLPDCFPLLQGGLLVAEFVDLPPMVDLAAGYSHLLMTDGSRVWSLGRHGPAANPATTAADTEPWLQPREVRAAPCPGCPSCCRRPFRGPARRRPCWQ
jgi:hypothetical protein